MRTHTIQSVGKITHAGDSLVSQPRVLIFRGKGTGEVVPSSKFFPLPFFFRFLLLFSPFLPPALAIHVYSIHSPPPPPPFLRPRSPCAAPHPHFPRFFFFSKKRGANCSVRSPILQPPSLPARGPGEWERKERSRKGGGGLDFWWDGIGIVE